MKSFFNPEDFKGLVWGITTPEQFGTLVSQRANEVLFRHSKEYAYEIVETKDELKHVGENQEYFKYRREHSIHKIAESVFKEKGFSMKIEIGGPDDFYGRRTVLRLIVIKRQE